MVRVLCRPGKIGLSVLCFAMWLGYTICLLVQTVPILKGFIGFRNSPNVSKEIQASIPQIMDTDYLISWVNETLALVYLPQYFLCVIYGLAMVSALLDTVCKNRVRLQFITTFLNSSSSMMFFLIAGMSLFSIVMCMLGVQLVQHVVSGMYEQLKTMQAMAGTEIPEVNELGSYNVTVQKALKWLAAQFFFLLMMLLVYLLYFCYWPHSLRMRSRKKGEKLTANIDGDSDDNL